MKPRRGFLTAWLLLLAAIGGDGCALRRGSKDAAPIVPPPPRASATARSEPPAAPPKPAPAVKPAPAKPHESPSLRNQAMADTSVASKALSRCRARRVLPGDEVIMESTQDLLRQARMAFAQGNVELAASYARSAKQLSSSLSCP